MLALNLLYVGAAVSDKPHVFVDRREIVIANDERFDRMEFAMQAVRLVKPPGMTVAVYEGCTMVRVDKGRDLRRGLGASWGMLSVPPHASRVDIALAVANLAGRTQDAYVLDSLLGPMGQSS